MNLWLFPASEVPWSPSCLWCAPVAEGDGQLIGAASHGSILEPFKAQCSPVATRLNQCTGALSHRSPWALSSPAIGCNWHLIPSLTIALPTIHMWYSCNYWDSGSDPITYLTERLPGALEILLIYLGISKMLSPGAFYKNC